MTGVQTCALPIWKGFAKQPGALAKFFAARCAQLAKIPGLKWDEVVANIERFKELRKQHPNIQLQVCCTVNVFNVLYLDRVAEWIVKQNFNFVYWNVMHDAWYFSVASLPEHLRLPRKALAFEDLAGKISF